LQAIERRYEPYHVEIDAKGSLQRLFIKLATLRACSRSRILAPHAKTRSRRRFSQAVVYRRWE